MKNVGKAIRENKSNWNGRSRKPPVAQLAINGAGPTMLKGDRYSLGSN